MSSECSKCGSSYDDHNDVACAIEGVETRLGQIVDLLKELIDLKKKEVVLK